MTNTPRIERIELFPLHVPFRAPVRAIEAIAPSGIDCAEQPVCADDWLGMARVQSRVAVPLMAHEGCFSLTDVTALIELGAVGGLDVALDVTALDRYATAAPVVLERSR